METIAPQTFAGLEKYDVVLINRIIRERAKGRSANGIAPKVRVGLVQVSTILRNKGVIQKIEELRAATTAKCIEKAAENESTKAILGDARRMLENFSKEAARKLKYIARHGEAKDRIRMEACQDILDRVGVKGNLVTEIINRNYTPEEIESAKKTLMEIESISARVTMSKSRFVLTQPGQSLLNTQEQDQNADTRPEQAGCNRQETLSTEPVLPL